MVSAEANFSLVGSKVTLISPDYQWYDAREKLGFIELPLTIQYQMNRFYYGAGPSIALMMFSKSKDIERKSVNIPYRQSFDVAGNLLAGYRISENLHVNIRYSHGFVNLYDEYRMEKTSNKVLSLSILYSLN